MNSTKRFALNTSYVLGASLFQKILGLVLVALIARSLNVENFGIYSAALAFAGTFIFITDLGINNYITRELAQKRRNASEILSEIVGLKLVLSIIAVGVIVGAAWLLGYSTLLQMAVFLAALSIVLDSFAGTLRTSFYSFEVLKFEFWITNIYRVLLLAASFAAIFFQQGLLVLLAVAAGASFVHFVLSALTVYSKIAKYSVRFHVSRVFALLFQTAPFMLSSTFWGIYTTVPAVLVLQWSTVSEVAYYSSAYRIVSAMAFLSTGFVSTLYPLMSRKFVQSSAQMGMLLQKSFKYLLIAVLPLAFLFSVLADRVMTAIYSSSFSVAGPVFQVMTWYTAFNFLNLVFFTFLNSTGREKQLAIFTGVALAFCLGANFFLIPLYGALGAAYAMVLTDALLFFLFFAYVRKIGYKVGVLSVLFKPLIASLCVAAFAWVFYSISLVALLVLSCALCFGILGLLKAFDAEDLRLFNEVIASKKAPAKAVE
ncbi:MAG: flippase [Candidatus Diapherotrites archaeon]